MGANAAVAGAGIRCHGFGQGRGASEGEDNMSQVSLNVYMEARVNTKSEGVGGVS